ncbi:class I SAM-dependent methyltransferase [Oryzomonas rubra]|uniref:class I SAM-dependent methyltransferase n=1 Tax=Oryzomonas rubra TaxID=2509454 RepID=UPI00165DE6F7|nr:DUF4942 domain-containing protein [Oryzomonas rubra]
MKVLEPSAGKGDLINGLKDSFKYSNSRFEVSAIEIDPILQAALRGNDVKVIDSDFMGFAGPDKFDLIIANPPFDDGDLHLLKALDIMYRGQIIFLLNAETLRNPHTNNRKLLVRRLEELGAEIEFIHGAFASAERKTNVEVALVNVVITRNVEDDLFAGCDDHAARAYQTVSDKNEVSTGRSIPELVAEYNEVVSLGTETILAYYKNYRKIGKYLGLNKESDSYSYSGDDLTGKMQGTLNALLVAVRTDFWRRTLELKDFKARLTSAKRQEFEHSLSEHCHMDFTESNIRQFGLNLIGSAEKTLTEAVLDIFDMFTVRHCWDDGLYEKNIHYFNGWKTNKAFKVGKRVVVPVRASYGSPFVGYSGWDLNYGAADFLDDIDKVMNYFDGGVPYHPMSDAIKNAFSRGESSGIQSTYFRITCHKKGTVHLTFRDDDILRRFNVVACRGKGWLPGDFGARPYRQLTVPERAVVDSFEGEKAYDANLQVALFGGSAMPMLELFA